MYISFGSMAVVQLPHVATLERKEVASVWHQ
jgi:hypothetical protein